MSQALAELIAGLADGRVQVVDLTRPLGPETPVIALPPQFASSPGVTIETLSRYDEAGPAWYWNVLHLGEHTGTHFDAPIHWITGKDLPDNTCETIPARRLVGPACVFDISEAVAENPDHLFDEAALAAWEEQHGRVPKGAWGLLRSGWSRRESAAEFLNAGPDGPHTPGFHQAVAELLVTDRQVLGLGAETVGTDAGQAGGFTPPFPVHGILAGNGCYGLASLGNLDRLPAIGALVIAAPLRIVGGSGSPARVLALVAK
jgi:kynurenine formamidase